MTDKLEVVGGYIYYRGVAVAELTDNVWPSMRDEVIDLVDGHGYEIPFFSEDDLGELMLQYVIDKFIEISTQKGGPGICDMNRIIKDLTNLYKIKTGETPRI